MALRLRGLSLGFGAEAAKIAAIQAVNFLTPLAALPFLARGLGMTTFGIYAIVILLSTYVANISDYTFNTNGPLRLNQELRRLPEDRTLLTVSVVVRLGLAALCTPIMVGVLGWVTGADAWLMVSACACVVATAATPRWAMYAQGRLSSFLAATAVSRGLWIIGAICVATTADSLWLLLAWTAGCQFFLAVVCWLMVRPPRLPALSQVFSDSRRLLREDFGLFLSSTAVALVRDGAPFALSMIHGPIAMSVYAVADRLRTAAIGLSAPLTQSLFLRLARSNNDPADARLRAIGNVVVLVPVTLGCVSLVALAEPIVLAIAGPEYVAAVALVQILLMAPPIVCFNALIGTNTLLVEGEHASFSRAQLIAAAGSVPIIVTLVYCWGMWGAAIATVAQETVLAATILWHLNRTSLLGRAFPMGRMNGNIDP